MRQYRAVGLFVLLGALWGAAYPAITVGVETVPPVLFAALRYDIAGLIMLAYVAYAVDYWYPKQRDDWIAVGLGGLLIIGAYNAFLFMGQTVVPSAVAAILIGLMPIFTTLFSRLLFPGDALTPWGLVGVLLGFAGVFVIARPDPSALLSSDLLGQLLVVIAAVSMALGSVLTQRFDPQQPPITMEAWSMALGAVVLHIAAAPRAPSVWAIEWTPSTIVALLYLAVCSSAVAYFIYFYLLDQLGAFEMNFIAYLAAAFGACFGWLILGEQLTVFTIAGYGLILAGFVLLKKERLTAAVGRLTSRTVSE